MRLRYEVMSLFGPVVRVPTQEPTSECGRFKALFDSDGRGAGVSVRWITLEVADSCRNDQNQAQSYSGAQVSLR